MSITIQRARKTYRCDAGFTCADAYGHADHSADTPRNVIRVGNRYVAVVYPPWTLTQEDPDSPPTKLGGWVTQRFHVECYGGPW